MNQTDTRKLKSKAADTLRKGKLRKALRLYEELEKLEPQEVAWPKHQADIYRRLNKRDMQIMTLGRAGRLYAGRGFIVQAIATYKMILGIDPHHEPTLKLIEELHPDAETSVAVGALVLGGRGKKIESGTPGGAPVSRGTAEEPTEAEVGADSDAPLEELYLVDRVPGSHPAELEEVESSGVNRVPLDSPESEELEVGVEIELDLDFEYPTASGHESRKERDEEQPRNPRERFALTPLFGSLDAGSLRRAAHGMKYIELPEGECLFRQGDPPGALYVIAEGAVVPIAEGPPRKKLAVLEEGDFFGEIGLVTNQPRNATIQALVDTKLLAIERKVVWQLIDRRPETIGVLLRFLRERLIDRLVRTSPVFQPFARSERPTLAQRFNFLEIADGRPVIRQGRPSDALFVLLAGQMDAVHSDQEGDRVLATLVPGDIFGEMSLLNREPSLATVTARGKCWALALPERSFRKLIARHTKLEELIARIAEERQRANWNTLRDPSRDPSGNRNGTVRMI